MISPKRQDEKIRVRRSFTEMPFPHIRFIGEFGNPFRATRIQKVGTEAFRYNHYG